MRLLLTLAMLAAAASSAAGPIHQDRYKVTTDPNAAYVVGQTRVKPSQWFGLTRTPATDSAVAVFRNGILQSQGEDFQRFQHQIVFTRDTIGDGELITLMYQTTEGTATQATTTTRRAPPPAPQTRAQAQAATARASRAEQHAKASSDRTRTPDRQ